VKNSSDVLTLFDARYNRKHCFCRMYVVITLICSDCRGLSETHTHCRRSLTEFANLVIEDDY